jgi:hypothetical protein
MRKMAIAILMLATAAVAHGGSARAAELVMFEEPGCAWCRRWHAEIGPAYPLTAEGRLAPLRRIHIRDQAIAGVSLERPVTVTPTFVLAEGGREIGRIVGYPGNEFFYGQLAELLKRVPGAPDLQRPRPDIAGGTCAATAQDPPSNGRSPMHRVAVLVG